MSLTGSLEDLSLTDIIQIISLSKRTGILEVESEDRRRGIIVFKNGLVVSALLQGKNSKSLGQSLVEAGLLRPDQVEQALALQRRQKTYQPIGQILVQQGWITGEVLERAVKQQIYRVLYELLQVSRGTFTFHLTEIIPYDEIRVDPIDLILLERGLSAQQLLLDAMKVRDEGRALRPSSMAEEAPGSFDEVAEEEAEIEASLEGLSVLLAFPQAAVRSYLSHILTQRGAVVVELSEADPEALLSRVAEWQRLAADLTVVVDVDVLPDPQAWIQAVRRRAGGVPILVVYRYIQPDLDEALRRTWNVYLLQSPFIPTGSPREVRGHVHILAQVLLDQLRKIRTSQAKPSAPRAPNLMERLWQELGLDEPFQAETPEDHFSKLMVQLKQALAELRHPSEVPQISLLILQFAAEFLDRGLLFLNTPQGIVGLGGFGDTGDDEPMPLKVRRIRLPQPVGDFAVVAQTGQPIRRSASEAQEWFNAFVQTIGRFRPSEYVIIPLVVQDQTVGFFYGDNAVTGRPLGDLTYLEIFLHQASFAIENAILNRRLSQAVFR
jgi:CheY-like chemotaxis protein